jgi:hypothetical protein
MVIEKNPVTFQGAPNLGYMSKDQLDEFAAKLPNAAPDATRKRFITSSLTALLRIGRGHVDLNIFLPTSEQKEIREAAIEKQAKEKGQNPSHITFGMTPLEVDITDLAELTVEDPEQGTLINLDTVQHILFERKAHLYRMGNTSLELMDNFIEKRRERLHDEESTWYDSEILHGEQ